MSFRFDAQTSVKNNDSKLITSPVRSPVDYTFSLSGNFGELRTTHFHTGIDIKPNRNGDVPILSIADGYVSRISIATGGYGNVLYIDHPESGLTSVYAHLSKFQPHIANAILNHQIAHESFTADLKFDPNLIPISRGEEIGIMGNTGYSFGRHLHFELRETSTEKPVNPFKYGIFPKDNTAPSISSIAFHGLDDNWRKQSEKRVSITALSGDSVQVITPITVPAGMTGLALQVFDKSDNAYNKNGIYSMRVYMDNALIFGYNMDRLSFEQNKQIIGFFDFAIRKKEDKTYTLCYKMPGNDLGFLADSGNGVIYVQEGETKQIVIEVADFFDNKRVLTCVLQGIAPEIKAQSEVFHQRINQGTKTVIDTAGAVITFEEQSLFRNIQCKIVVDTLGFENIYVIGDDLEPIKKPILLAIKPKLSAQDDPSKAIILHRNGVSYGGEWKDGYLTTRIGDFGRYTIAYDNQAPSIKSVNFTASAHKKDSFNFTIKDNYGTRGDDVDEISYKVWIDGMFVVSPFRQLNSTLTIPIEDVGPGEHTLKIEARDHSGNYSYFDNIFRR
jgi:hypothetical protein